MNLYVDNSLIGFINTTSDRRVKHSITPITASCLDRIKRLKPVNYSFKDIGIFKDDGVIKEGFVADELQQVISSAVLGEKDAVDKDGNIQPQSLQLVPIVAVLTKALQELNEKFDAYVASHP
jgi:hypothetical protein